MPFTHKIIELHVSFGGVPASVLLDSGASQNFIAAPQLTIFNNSIKKSLLCPDESIEVLLADNSLVVSHQIMHL